MAKFQLTKTQFEELGDELDGDLRPDYSGRGMFGATCLGYTTDDGPTQFQIELAKILGPEILHYDEGEEFDLDDLDDVIEELGPPISDSMGLSTIYYFPKIQIEGHARKSAWV